MSEQNVVDVPSHAAAGDFEPEFDGGEFESGSDGEPEGGTLGQPGPGMGQSKSSRRRRRKRKKLATVAGSAEGVAPAEDGQSVSYTPIVMEGESIARAQAPEPRAHSNGNNGNGNNGGGSQPQASGQGAQSQGGQAPTGQGKRWKKKFRDRERRGRDASPSSGSDARPEGGYSNNSGGNNAGSSNGGGHYERPHRSGGRPDNFGNLIATQGRKQKSQNRERGFVGPMDHSYREGNPEFGDIPPSTISTRGRRSGHHGDSQPIDRNAPRPKPVPEDAQTHIYLFIEDLFVTAKVNETARKMGIKVSFVKNDKDAVAELTSGEELNKPTLIVFDLNNAAAKPLTLIPKLKTKLKRSCSIIGFLSHLQGDLKAKAVEAGCDVVMPRSAFSQGLPNLLRRYGADETEEINYNY